MQDLPHAWNTRGSGPPSLSPLLSTFRISKNAERRKDISRNTISGTLFGHESGRHWPDLDDTLGFESWSLGPHFGPILGPRGAQKHPEKKTNTILKDPFKIKNCFSALAISASSARRFFPLLTCAGAGHIRVCVCVGGARTAPDPYTSTRFGGAGGRKAL